MHSPWLGGALLVASYALIPLGVQARRLAVGSFSCLTILTLLRALVIAGSWLLNRPLSSATEKYSALAVWLLTLAVTLVGLVNARRTAQVKTVEVTIAGLPAAFDGYRIAQISDIHIGLTLGRRYLERITPLGNLRDKDGGVLGNHE